MHYEVHDLIKHMHAKHVACTVNESSSFNCKSDVIILCEKSGAISGSYGRQFGSKTNY